MDGTKLKYEVLIVRPRQSMMVEPPWCYRGTMVSFKAVLSIHRSAPTIAGVWKPVALMPLGFDSLLVSWRDVNYTSELNEMSFHGLAAHDITSVANPGPSQLFGTLVHALAT